MKRILTLLIGFFALGITTILAQCDATFTYTKSAVNPSLYYFYDSTGSAAYNSYWSVSDGTSSTSMHSFTHSFANNGTYTVCHIVSDGKGTCLDSFCATVVVTGIKFCSADFSYTLRGDSVYFITKPSATTYSWSYGDGTSSSTYSGWHKYNTGGVTKTYTVCCSITDTSGGGCSDTVCKTITVTPTNPCHAYFYADVKDSSAGFVNQSSYKTGSSTVHWYWSMGDGSTYNVKGPYHTYSKPGAYLVCMYMADTVNNCFSSYCDSVVIDSAKTLPCVSDFSYKQNHNEVYFFNRNTGGVSWVWYFGDGDSSTAAHPFHQYNKVGTYSVCLTITCAGGYCFTKCDSIVVDTIINNCVADFDFSTSSLYVAFTNKSTGTATGGGMSYQWSFGDGSSSTAVSPSHTYSSAGTYTVCLFMYNSNCSDSICKTVKVDSAACKAQFRIAVDTTQKFKLYLINSSSNLTTHTYSWSFGDGSSSSQRNPTHSYSTFGLYQVCLTVADTLWGCTSTWCDSLGLDSNGKLLKAGAWELEVIEDDFSSVENISKSNVTVYPNPAKTELIVETQSFIKADQIEVYNMNGVRMNVNVEAKGQQAIVDVSQINPGMYVIIVNNGTSVSRSRFVKID
ncbi:MAG: PKD domain-containing protein [Bacteroidetes bacterium]|nr:PKD domain-containing protein [Bacteroidota bacterium]